MSIEDTIEDMLNKPYVVEGPDQSHRHVCWSFCCEIYNLFDMQLQPLLYYTDKQALYRVAEPQLNCIVLFHMVLDWHAGVVWPDILHFIHAAPVDIHDRENTAYIACKERLTVWPHNLLIEGYYAA